MDKNKSCFACNIKLDTDTYKKDTTVCKRCYNRKIRKNNNTQKSKVLITITITIESQTSNENLVILEVLESRKSRSPRT